MNLNQVSVGGGLGLLALGLSVNAGAFLAGGGSAAALGDGARRGAGLSGPEGSAWPGGPRRASPRRMSMGAADGCVEGSPLDWFGAIREFPECGFQYGPPRHGDEIVDVNGDGLVESFVREKGLPVATSGMPLPDTCFVSLVITELVGDATRVAVSCILRSQPLAEWILSRTSWQGDINCDFGWNDIDRDGDMDMVVGFHCACGSGYDRRYAWLENTGFEASRPLVGDLNRDGNIDSADLTMLLGGWTGN